MTTMLGAAECYSLPAANADLYIRDAEGTDAFDVGTAIWTKIGGLDSYTEAYPTNTTDQTSAGWIRSMVTQAGYTVTVSGKRAPDDPGQAAVNTVVYEWRVGCPRIRAFRFVVKGAHEGDPEATDVAFWSSPTMSDSALSGADDATWGVELISYQKPVDCEGEPLVEAQPSGASTQAAPAPSTGSSSTSTSDQSASSPSARKSSTQTAKAA